MTASAPHTDPLSDVLEVMGLETHVTHSLALPGSYAVGFPRPLQTAQRWHVVRPASMVDDEDFSDAELGARAFELLQTRQRVSVAELRTQLGIQRVADTFQLTQELEAAGLLGPADPQIVWICMATCGSFKLKLSRRQLVELRAGDIALIPGTKPLVLCDNNKRRDIANIHDLRDSTTGYPPRLDLCGAPGSAAPAGEGIVGHLRLRTHLFNPLAQLFSRPFVVRAPRSTPDELPASQAQPSLLTGLQQLLDPGLPSHGTVATSERLLELLLLARLVEAEHAPAAASQPESRSGPLPDARWLRALADPNIGAALRVMHGAPGRAWTNTELGYRSGLRPASKGGASSGSTRLPGPGELFTQRFCELLDIAPEDYLTRWRLELSAHLLARDPREDTVEALATQGCYATPEDFHQLFKRNLGLAPADWATLMRERPALPG